MDFLFFVALVLLAYCYYSIDRFRAAADFWKEMYTREHAAHWSTVNKYTLKDVHRKIDEAWSKEPMTISYGMKPGECCGRGLWNDCRLQACPGVIEDSPAGLSCSICTWTPNSRLENLTLKK